MYGQFYRQSSLAISPPTAELVGGYKNYWCGSMFQLVAIPLSRSSDAHDLKHSLQFRQENLNTVYLPHQILLRPCPA